MNLSLTGVPIHGLDGETSIVAHDGRACAVVGNVCFVDYPDYLKERGARDFYFLHIMGESIDDLPFPTIEAAAHWALEHRADAIARYLTTLPTASTIG
jgi:hypothetical protein